MTLKKKIFIGFVLVISICLLIILQFFAAKTLFRVTPESPSKIITSNPLDLTTIESISKFRSCQGHDFSGYNINNEWEGNRSMKHYIIPKEEFAVVSKTPVYAPFDGVVKYQFPESRGAQTLIKHNSTNWYFVIFHLELVNGLHEESEIKAGQLLGFAQTPDGTNFDLAMQYEPDNTILDRLTTSIIKIGYPPFFSYLESPFEFMSDSVLEEFEKYGITQQKVKHTKEFRDQKPCDFDNEKLFREEDFVELRK